MGDGVKQVCEFKFSILQIVLKFNFAVKKKLRFERKKRKKRILTNKQCANSNGKIIYLRNFNLILI